MSDRVKGKVALITGAARGQGRSHAIRLAQEGADIIAIDMCQDIATNHYPLATLADLDETARLVKDTGQRVVTIVADVRERSAMMAAVKQGVDELGRLDIVVANAGICPLGSDVPPQGFFDAVAVDLVGVYNTIEASFPSLTAGASIIATGSVAGMIGGGGGTESAGNGPGGAGYSHSKRGVARLVHDMALQLAPHSIRVNAVHPTNVNTDMLQSQPMYNVFRPDIANPTREDAMLAFPSMQVMPIPYVEAVDISNAVLFLASDEAQYVTGVQLKVDGGSLLRSTTSGAPG